MASLESGSIPAELIVDSTTLISQGPTTSSQEFLQQGPSISGGVNATLENVGGVAGHQEPEEGDAQERLRTFWQKQMEEIQNMSPNEFKTQELPLARIKKIMKMDEEVKMISAEAPLLFSKAVQIFIHELGLRAWIHTEESKRRTLQRNDVQTAITKFDQFDFLIDIVPREELKPAPRKPFSPSSSTDNTMPCFYTMPQQNSGAAAPAPSAAATVQTAAGLQTGQLLVAQQGQNGQPLTLMPVNIDGAQILQLAQAQQQQSGQQQQASALLLNAATAASGGQLTIQTQQQPSQPQQQQQQQQQQENQPQQQGIIQIAQANDPKPQQQQQQLQQQNLGAVLQQLLGNASNTAGEAHMLQVNAQGQLQLVKVVNSQQTQNIAVGAAPAGNQGISGNNQIFNLEQDAIQVDAGQEGANINAAMFVNADE